MSSDTGLPPGQTVVLRAYVTTWAGEGKSVTLDIVSAKPRFIQDDMKDVFKAVQYPKPVFTIETRPYELLDEKFLGKKVVITKTAAVIKNPNPGNAKEAQAFGLFYDDKGQMVGFAMSAIVEVPGGGQTEIEMTGTPYFTGIPARVDYYAFMADAYYIEEIFKLW